MQDICCSYGQTSIHNRSVTTLRNGIRAANRISDGTFPTGGAGQQRQIADAEPMVNTTEPRSGRPQSRRRTPAGLVPGVRGQTRLPAALQAWHGSGKVITNAFTPGIACAEERRAFFTIWTTTRTSSPTAVPLVVHSSRPLYFSVTVRSTVLTSAELTAVLL
jgi:hypothetical protein